MSAPDPPASLPRLRKLASRPVRAPTSRSSMPAGQPPPHPPRAPRRDDRRRRSATVPHPEREVALAVGTGLAVARSASCRSSSRVWHPIGRGHRFPRRRCPAAAIACPGGFDQTALPVRRSRALRRGNRRGRRRSSPGSRLARRRLRVPAADQVGAAGADGLRFRHRCATAASSVCAASRSRAHASLSISAGSSSPPSSMRFVGNVPDRHGELMPPRPWPRACRPRPCRASRLRRSGTQPARRKPPGCERPYVTPPALRLPRACWCVRPSVGSRGLNCS